MVADLYRDNPEWVMVALAEARTQVRLDDGRVGTLVYWPLPRDPDTPRVGRSSGGAKPKVRLETGRYVSVPRERITAVLK